MACAGTATNAPAATVATSAKRSDFILSPIGQLISPTPFQARCTDAAEENGFENVNRASGLIFCKIK